MCLPKTSIEGHSPENSFFRRLFTDLIEPLLKSGIVLCSLIQLAQGFLENRNDVQGGLCSGLIGQERRIFGLVLQIQCVIIETLNHITQIHRKLLHVLIALTFGVEKTRLKRREWNGEEEEAREIPTRSW